MMSTRGSLVPSAPTAVEGRGIARLAPRVARVTRPGGCAPRAGGGPGLSRRLGDFGSVYAFLEASADASTALVPAYALAAGVRGGVQFGERRDRWRGHLHGGVDSYFLGDTRTAFRLGFDQRLQLTKRVGLELAITGTHDFGKTWLDTDLFLRAYY